MIKNYLRIAALLLTFISIVPSAKAQDTTDVRKNQYGVVVERVPLTTESRNGILVFESKDMDTRYWFDVRVYFDGAYFMGETLNPIGSGVDIRRARLGFKANLKGNWYGEIDLDFAGSAVELKDMILMYDANNWGIKAGHFKESFSMETTTTSRYLTFIERSLVSKMAPSRHLGVQGTFYGRHFNVLAGIHGRTVGEMEEVTFALDNNKDFGAPGGYSFTGRLVGRPVYNDDFMLHIGAAASYRTPKSSLEILDSYRYSTRSLTNINRKKYIDTDDIKDVDHNLLLGGELAGSFRNFMFQSEYIQDQITRKNDLSEVVIGGGYFQCGVLLFGGKYNYNYEDGEFTQPTFGRTWGDLELALRYDYVNANDFDAKVYGGAAEGYTVGLNYFPISNVKLMLNYSYLNHDRFANGKGALYIYKDEAGVLYKNPFEVDIPTGKGGDDFGFVSFRVEVDF